MKENYIS